MTGCRKLQYRKRREARAASRRFEQRNGRPLRVYVCPTCGYWHLTSQRKQEAT